jgi:hypothetical protein
LVVETLLTAVYKGLSTGEIFFGGFSRMFITLHLFLGFYPPFHIVINVDFALFYAIFFTFELIHSP